MKTVFNAGSAANGDVSGPATGAPDFSANGAPIQFGYRTATLTNCSFRDGCFADSGTVYLDNYSVNVVSAVPEPSTMWLAVAGLAIAAARVRRR